METEQVDGVVAKTMAMVRDMFGMSPGDNAAPRPREPMTEAIRAESESASKEDMRLNPDDYTFKSIAEVSAENARREGGQQPLFLFRP
jgi:hypothetical protein